MKQRSVPEGIGLLPHWARVAFAARCARGVLPLFERYWPAAEPRRREAMETATRLAEQSAREGGSAAGLDRAIVESVMAAGVAILPIYRGFPITEPVPADETASYVASFAVKAAEWAATAAQQPPSGSAHAALESYTYACDAAERAGADDVPTQLQNDFDGLARAAARGRWSDATPVPPQVFALLDNGPPEKSWWEFWR